MDLFGQEKEQLVWLYWEITKRNLDRLAAVKISFLLYADF